MSTFAFMGNGYLMVTVLFLIFTVFSDQINTVMRQFAIKLAPAANLSPIAPKTVWQSYATSTVIAVIPYVNAAVFVFLVVLIICTLVFVKNMGIKIEKLKQKSEQEDREFEEKYPTQNLDVN